MIVFGLGKGEVESSILSCSTILFKHLANAEDDVSCHSARNDARTCTQIGTKMAQRQPEWFTHKNRAEHQDQGRTFVYVLECAGRVKIGLARDVEARRIDLGFSCPLPISTICQRKFPSRKAAAAAERFLHAALETHRTHGEWFDMPPETAARALNDAPDEAPLVTMRGKLKPRALPPMPAPRPHEPRRTYSWDDLTDEAFERIQQTAKSGIGAFLYTPAKPD